MVLVSRQPWRLCGALGSREELRDPAGVHRAHVAVRGPRHRAHPAAAQLVGSVRGERHKPDEMRNY